MKTCPRASTSKHRPTTCCSFAEIQKTDASVWITFDSCHSGSMIRGAGNEQTRDLDPVKDLGIPRAAIAQAEKEAREREARKPATNRGIGEPPTPFKLAEKG